MVDLKILVVGLVIAVVTLVISSLVVGQIKNAVTPYSIIYDETFAGTAGAAHNFAYPDAAVVATFMNETSTLLVNNTPLVGVVNLTPTCWTLQNATAGYLTDNVSILTVTAQINGSNYVQVYVNGHEVGYLYTSPALLNVSQDYLHMDSMNNISFATNGSHDNITRTDLLYYWWQNDAGYTFTPTTITPASTTDFKVTYINRDLTYPPTVLMQTAMGAFNTVAAFFAIIAITVFGWYVVSLFGKSESA